MTIIANALPEGNKSERFRKLFNRISSGDEDLAGGRRSKLFLEAICDQPEPIACVQRLISSTKGLSALFTALCSDFTPSFLNSHASGFLEYIQAQGLQDLGQGQFLQPLLLQITDPPIFWDNLNKNYRLGLLDARAVKGFAWLLSQLILLPSSKAWIFYPVAQDPGVLKSLLESPHSETRRLAQRIKHVLEVVANSDPVGEESAGGRHDNDFANIREINVFPTVDEVLAKDPPYLRTASDLQDCLPDGRLNMQIDNQFRLLREDMLRDLREELQIVFGHKQGRRRGQRIESLSIDSLVTNERRPWSFAFACNSDIPELKRFKTTKERQNYVKHHHSFLKHQSLACITTDGRLTALVVLIRDEDLLTRTPPIICAQFPGRSEGINRALYEIKFAQKMDLVQLSTAMFAYEPVLKQLQEIKELSLAEELMLWQPNKKMRGSNFHENERFSKLISVLEQNPSKQLQGILQLPKPVQLDDSQAKCLLGGLKDRLILVQGPPGTGKSFIGALIAKALYLYSKETILVVCYTNHALDQFLEDLIQTGIQTDSIVRLGSYNKATSITKPLALSENKSRFRPGRFDQNMLSTLKNRLPSEDRSFRESFRQYISAKVAKNDIMCEIEFDEEFPDLYDALQIPESSDGMQLVGKGGKAMSQFYFLDCWLKMQLPKAGPHFQKTLNPRFWNMPQAQRDRLLLKWKSNVLRARIDHLNSQRVQYADTQAQIDTIFQEKDREYVKNKRIIGCTTTAAAKYVQTIQAASPGVLLVEEAGEILESHILTALGAKTSQAILIGDHQQLRPKVHYDLSVEKGDGYDLNRSLFERLVIQGYPHQILHKQHRMRPEISAFVRGLTYPDLLDADSTQSRPDIRGLQDNIIFCNHNVPEEDAGGVAERRDQNSISSKRNIFEANMTLKIVRYLGQQGYGTEKIVVLTPYLAQLKLLLDVLAKENDPVLNDLDSYDLVQAGLMTKAAANLSKRKLRISTIDNYQGEESEIVVVSLTRCNKRGDIGFLSAPERLNVLLSRARDGMILIGNSDTFLSSRKGKDLWGKFFGLLKDSSHLYDGFPVYCERHPSRKLLLSKPEEFEACSDGGCDESCAAILGCGLHACEYKCHQLVDHSKMSCHQVVRSKCNVGHVQSRLCFQGVQACTACEKKRKADEKRIRDDYKRQLRIQQEQLEHDLAIAKLDEELRIVRETNADKQRSEELAASLVQKKKDLENARLQRMQADMKSNEATHQNLKSPPVSNGRGSQSSPSQPAGADAKVSPRKPLLQDSPSRDEWERQKRVEGAANDALDSLMAMTGLEEVKRQVLAIKDKIDTSARQGIDLKDERFGIVLLGNPGTGKTTVARLYAKFLTSVGILPGSEFVETSGSKLANDGVNGARALIDTIIKAGGGAFFLDEAYQLASGANYGGAAVLDFLLAEIENRVGTIVFILAGYNKQMEKFFEHNQGFSSRMPYRLQFSDYQDRELLDMLVRRVEKKYNQKMKIEGGLSGLYTRIAVRRLGQGRGREGFGNARALENILAKVSERQSSRLKEERKNGLQPDDFLYKKEDIIGPDPSTAIVDSAAWKELQTLIGLATVKESIQGLVDRIQLNYKRELEEKTVVEVSLNRVFLGSPGTGKTSVGKLYGQILVDLGLLSNGEVVIKNPADFVGSVLGESEKNTKAILKATEGKVLIIDEAYMLYSGAGGTSSVSDPYKTAVIDTIVAEIQSTIGEDRCVLLLGYRLELEEMFRNCNPGLSRRFPLDDAFSFEDFDDAELRRILDLKLKKQDLNATDEAKDAAMSVLGRARHRPNFGNAGEVENLISRAKGLHQSRQSKVPVKDRPIDIVFEAQDFDPDFDRASNATVDCRELFKDVLGSEEVIAKLEGYCESVKNMRKRNIDPRRKIPFNFIFKGPPGTGKTTTARKMGEVFYRMGFLSSNIVDECSASDLVAGFVGQTALKTKEVLEKSLGRVLFIDEAYRLGEGNFATEAINELVDNLTKPQFLGKMVVILAGYEQDMNSLLQINPGLSSRFSEEVNFTNMEPHICREFLFRNIEKDEISIEDKDSASFESAVDALFAKLSNIPAWGNGRDVKTIATSISNKVFRTPTSSSAQLNVSQALIIQSLEAFFQERRARSVNTTAKTLTSQSKQATQDASSSPPKITAAAPPTQIETLQSEEESPQSEEIPTPDTSITPATVGGRDAGVPDEIWNQLMADKKAAENADIATARSISDADKQHKRLSQVVDVAKEQLRDLSMQKAQDDRNEELRRKHEQMRIELVKQLRAKDEAEERERVVREKAAEERKKERKAQEKLRDMGVCPVGYQWIKQEGGYRCAAGGHFVSNEALHI
ncbi:MAG: hypothetical protein M1814_000943 [Vezdaea aestivalis]|nr:MAG: hypothetical protein M1814_000943 [Vezdaea aestivalis]